MNRWIWLFCSVLLVVWAACSPAARPRKSFEEICTIVEGKTTVEVEKLLGKPNFQKLSDMGDERWIWWNYAELDGESYPPEVRGRVVHLEITFAAPSGPAGGSLPHSQWRVRQPFGVAYLFPDTKQSI